MGCSSSSTQTLAQENRPRVKAEDASGDSPLHHNGVAEEVSETISDQMQLPVQSAVLDEPSPGPGETEEPERITVLGSAAVQEAVDPADVLPASKPEAEEQDMLHAASEPVDPTAAETTLGLEPASDLTPVQFTAVQEPKPDPELPDSSSEPALQETHAATQAAPVEPTTVPEPIPAELPLNVDSEPAPEPPTVEPAPEPTTVEPAPEPTTVEPAPEPTTVEPAPALEPTSVEPAPALEPTSVELSPALEPTSVEPSPTLEPAPEPSSVEPSPAPEQIPAEFPLNVDSTPALETTSVEPSPAPVPTPPLEPTSVETTLAPEPTSVEQNPAPEPTSVEPSPTPEPTLNVDSIPPAPPEPTSVEPSPVPELIPSEPILSAESAAAEDPTSSLEPAEVEPSPALEPAPEEPSPGPAAEAVSAEGAATEASLPDGSEVAVAVVEERGADLMKST